MEFLIKSLGKAAPSHLRAGLLVLSLLGVSHEAPATLLVSDTAADAVFELDSTGQVVQLYSSDFSDGPFGAASGPYSTVYVVSEDDEVAVFDRSGAFLGVPTFGRPDSHFFRNPRDAVFGPDGNLYAGTQNRDTWVFDPITGEVLRRVPGADESAFGLTFGNDGFLYVAQAFENKVSKVDPVTGQRTAFVSPGSGGLDFPTGLEFGPDGNLYVTSIDTSSVLRFDGVTGDFIDVFVSGLWVPYDVAFGPDDLLYVSEAQGVTSRVRRFDSSGAFVDTFFESPTVSTQLKLTYLAFEPEVAVVSEPTTVGLFGLGIVMLGFFGRRT